MNEASRTSFLDMLFVLILVFILLPHQPEIAKEETLEPKGNLIIEVSWPDHMNVDVDLWVQGPTGPPVGYSAKNSRYLDLLRDDLGRVNDLGNLNYEIVYGRDVPSGDYIINLHLYNNRNAGAWPVIPVDLTVFTDTPNSSKTRVIEERVKLNFEGEEITAVRFYFDTETGQIRDRNYVFRPVRSS